MSDDFRFGDPLPDLLRQAPRLHQRRRRGVSTLEPPVEAAGRPRPPEPHPERDRMTRWLCAVEGRRVGAGRRAGGRLARGGRMSEPYYQDDLVTLYHGDALSVLESLPAESVGLAVTDPPYFQPASHYVSPRGEKTKRRSIGDMSILELAFKSWSAELARIVRQDGTIYMFCDGQSYPLAFTGLYPYAKYVRPLIWDKETSYNGYTWRHQHELIAWAEMPQATRIPTGDGDVIRCRAVPVAERDHPAQKPQALIETLVGKHPKTIVIDPFAGSGSTLEAARAVGRKSVGIEIDERYCEALALRLAQPEQFIFGGVA